AEAPELSVERLARDAEAAGGGGLRGQGVQPLQDQRQLEAGEKRGERRERRRASADRGREMVRPDTLVVADGEHEAVDLVLQLAHVARPRVVRQRVERLRCEACRLPPLLALEAGEEARREERDLADALAERRHLDREDGQPVVEIPPEPAGLDL